MTRFSPILIASALLAACAGRPAPVSKPAPPVTSDTAVVMQPVVPAPAHSDTHQAESGADYAAAFDGLINIAGVAQLPDPIYPGRGFHVGVFDDPASWARFTRAAEIDPFASIDWTRQVVVYTVLDGQTNMLGLDSFAADGQAASMQILWVGIEPHYVDATPAVLTLVDRGELQEVRIAAGDLPLGTVTL